MASKSRSESKDTPAKIDVCEGTGVTILPGDLEQLIGKRLHNHAGKLQG